LRKNDLRMWNGFAWLRIRNGGGHLWTQQCTLYFHKRRGLCWLTERTMSDFWRRTLTLLQVDKSLLNAVRMKRIVTANEARRLILYSCFGDKTHTHTHTYIN
jgi:hypothetical protein